MLSIHLGFIFDHLAKFLFHVFSFINLFQHLSFNFSKLSNAQQILLMLSCLFLHYLLLALFHLRKSSIPWANYILFSLNLHQPYPVSFSKIYLLIMNFLLVYLFIDLLSFSLNIPKLFIFWVNEIQFQRFDILCPFLFLWLESTIACRNIKLLFLIQITNLIIINTYILMPMMLQYFEFDKFFVSV